MHSCGSYFVHVPYVVVIGILGKTVSLGMVAGNSGLAITLEYLIETIAGLMIACLGLLFLTAII